MASATPAAIKPSSRWAAGSVVPFGPWTPSPAWVDGDQAAAVRVAMRVLEALRRPATIDGRPVLLQASVGIALGHAGSRAEELLRDADRAMYAAKAKGTGLCEVFEPQDDLQA